MFNMELLLLCQIRDTNSKSRRNALNLEQCTVNYREEMQSIIKKYLISYGKKIKIKCNMIVYYNYENHITEFMYAGACTE